MNRYNRIISRLTAEFEPDFLELHDDSAHHAGHAGAREGGETHYHVRIVSGKFNGLSQVQRQQAIYKALEGEFKSGLHALSIEAQTPA